ncbi:MAG: DUF1294 domain-containing protein [Bacillota bacterium]|jgi:uncharacterized membrane protein YsdA (DUF1294 family)|nr:DUF1294 domain-containing protein [Clostridia bacterium]
MEALIIIYYIVLNCWAFIFMGWDKHQARRKGKRISEKTLLLLALGGGFVGAYGGMKVFRHKTRHRYFVFVFVISLLVHMIIWI